MAYHKIGVYDGFDSLAEVKRHYRRYRRAQDFILEEKAIEKLNPVCAHCGKKFSEHETASSPSNRFANRCQYDPATKKIAIFQYYCAWEGLLAEVCDLANRLY